MDKSKLTALASQVLDYARAAGATAADTEVETGHGLSLSVRMGELETVEHTRDQGMGITAYVGKKRGHASTGDLSPAALKEAAEKAVTLAKYAAEDEFSGLPDKDTLATVFPDLDLNHPWAISAEDATTLAQEMEAAAFAVDKKRIRNSDGANVGAQHSGFIYANTDGFCAGYESTRHSAYVGVIAEDDTGMQQGYWYDSGRCADDFIPAAQIGRIAGERAVSRLGARRLPTQKVPVLFDAQSAGGLIGSFVGAVSGGALYRKTSFLQDALHTPVFPKWFSIEEQPFLMRGPASEPFDEEGVAPRQRFIIKDGVLMDYFLGTYAARKLGLRSTGNAGGNHNLICTPGTKSLTELAREMRKGLLVTDLMGQGVNAVTGDYSRGAAGFWVENGEIAYPVEEITIAGNLKTMYQDIVAVGNDIERRGSKHIGSVLIREMSLAGA
jgi:PmbA protein